MIRLACFDLDGTLVSSLPEIAAGVRELARRESLPEPSDAVVGNMIGGGVRVLIERLAAWWRGSGESPAIDEETLLKRLVAIWSAMDGGLIALIPGAFEGVRALRDAGVSTWLVTNKEESLARAFLERRGLTDAFDGILGAHARPGVRLKPFPDMIEFAMREAGASREETIMVGDSRNDALAARAAGVRALLVETGYNEGEPLARWAQGEGFTEVLPDAGAACAKALREIRDEIEEGGE